MTNHNLMELTKGKPISTLLSTYLREWTSDKDISEVANKVEMSFSSVRDLRLGKNSITDNNEKVVTELLKIAVKNCTNKIAYAKKSIKVFENQLEVA